MAAEATSLTPTDAPPAAWYRDAEGIDHAFPTGTGWMRSRCGLRWTAALSLVEGTVRPCSDCQATESERRALWGDR